MYENAQKLVSKLRAEFPATTRGHSMAKISHLDDAFSDVFEREAGPVECQSLHQKDKKRSKKLKKMKSLKTWAPFSSNRNLFFCACPNKNVVKRDLIGKKGMLSCCKCLFE